MAYTVRLAGTDDADLIARMVKRLTDEIIRRTGAQHFNVDLAVTTQRCRAFLADGRYTVLLVAHGDTVVGFAALCVSHALYAEGTFGVVQEFYVEPSARSRGAGAVLIDVVADHGRQRGWTRLELCTPPLPEFDRALSFYERHGFEITGGRKMKRLL